MVYLETLKVPSLKEACRRRLEELILSGELKIGERLPAERDLARRLDVSRPVLHEALVDLGSRGLVQILPRRGVFISDYRRNGSLALLSSLLSYHDDKLDPAFTQSLMDIRTLLETETARQAALNRSDEQLAELHDILTQEARASGDVQLLTGLDFSFHLLIAIASANLVYPLIINSFQGVYTSLTGAFFRKYTGSPVIAAVHQYHIELVRAVQARDDQAAVRQMRLMLQHGEKYLKGENP